MRKQQLLAFTIFTCGLICRAGYAEKCDFQDLPIPEIAGHNMWIEMPSGQTITLLELTHSPNEVRSQASHFFATQKSVVPDLQEQILELLKSQVFPLGSQRRVTAYLQNRLAEKPPPDYIAVESPQKDIDGWESVANEVYMYELPQLRDSGFREGLWDSLLLITIEPIFYLKVKQHQLFDHTQIKGIDLMAAIHAPPEEPKAPVAEDPQKRLDRLTAEIRKSLASNQKTLQAFNKIVQTFNPDAAKYRGLSDSQIRKDVIIFVWKPARKSVGDWVDAKIAAVRTKPPPPSEPPTGAIKTKTFYATELVDQIRKFEGNGVVVIGDTYFLAVAKALHDSCLATRE